MEARGVTVRASRGRFRNLSVVLPNTLIELRFLVRKI